MSLMCIDLYETDGLLLFSSKSIIFQTTDLERVIEKAENIYNFYLDFNWEFQFIGLPVPLPGRNSGTFICLLSMHYKTSKLKRKLCFFATGKGHPV